MKRYMRPEDIADSLSLDSDLVLEWIAKGELPAVRLNNQFRVSEDDLSSFLGERLYQGATNVSPDSPESSAGDEHLRSEKTFGKRRQFRVSGNIRLGARIWPGKARSPLFFSAEFFKRMMTQFQGREVPAGLNFSNPGEGSLGDWIQKNLPTKMNPTYCVAGLLVAEGFAEPTKGGRIRFASNALQRLEMNQSDTQRERREAAENIRSLRKGLNLGPDLTIRDLIEEGRRF